MCICLFSFVLWPYRECSDGYGNMQILVIMCQDMISSFRYKVDEIHALLGYYTAYSGNSLPTVWDNISEQKGLLIKFLDPLRQNR
jgi:hypothetical protein